MDAITNLVSYLVFIGEHGTEKMGDAVEACKTGTANAEQQKIVFQMLQFAVPEAFHA